MKTKTTAKQALENVLAIVQRYMPPDGPTAHDAMTEIIGVVDPWPLPEEDRPEIQQVREVWVPWANTDLTEGRGYQVPVAVCSTEATALRKGKGRDIAGSDCEVTKTIAVLVHGHGWLVPGVIQLESYEDKAANAQLNARRAALEKAKAAGLTEEEIAALGVKA